MRQLLLLITLILTFGQLNAQDNKHISIPVYGQNDTSFWYKWIDLMGNRIDSNDLKNDRKLFHFRYWNGPQILEIWIDDNKKVAGKLTNFAVKDCGSDFKICVSDSLNIFKSTKILGDSVAESIYNVIIRDSIDKIQTKQLLKGWLAGWVGAELIEISDLQSYYVRDYNGYKAQPNNAEYIDLIRDFFKELNVLINFQKEINEFTQTLPEGDYSNNGIIKWKNKKNSR